MATLAKRTEQEQAITQLRSVLHPGDTVYTILRHVSASGMTRSISAVVLDDGAPHDWSWAVARALGETFDNRREGVKVGGCGMDMGFHLIYNLSATLFPDGFECTGEHCPSNDHTNGDRDYTPHHHRSGGYALRQRWL